MKECAASGGACGDWWLDSGREVTHRFLLDQVSKRARKQARQPATGSGLSLAAHITCLIGAASSGSWKKLYKGCPVTPPSWKGRAWEDWWLAWVVTRWGMLTEYQPPNSRQNQKCQKIFTSAYLSLRETKVLGTSAYSSEAEIISILQRLALCRAYPNSRGMYLFTINSR